MQAEVGAINNLITALAAITGMDALSAAIDVIDARIYNWGGIALVGINNTALQTQRDRLAESSTTTTGCFGSVASLGGVAGVVVFLAALAAIVIVLSNKKKSKN